MIMKEKCIDKCNRETERDVVGGSDRRICFMAAVWAGPSEKRPPSGDEMRKAPESHMIQVVKHYPGCVLKIIQVVL